MNILIVEDEPRLAEVLAHILEESGYHTETVADGDAALAYARSNLYDLLLLDVMIPGKSGIEVVRTMRPEGIDTPVLMLTARTETSDKVEGLDAGADDYMTKPFEPEELLARVRALLRRQGKVVLDEITCGDLTLDLSSHELVCNRKRVHLSRKEFEVAQLLMASPNQVFSKETLLNKVWGVGGEATENSVEAYISFLRKKLRFLKSKVDIDTIRMLGYRIFVPDEA